MCCFDDLQSYLDVLSEDERASVHATMSGVAELAGQSVRLAVLNC